MPLKYNHYQECSHDAWLQSVRNGEASKWLLEEDFRGVGHYFRVDQVEENNPWANGGDGPQRIREKKAREQMRKKVSKHEKPFVWRLGYNHCIGQFPQSDEYPTLSGSSLNRKKREATKSRRTDEVVMHKLSARSKGKIKDKATAFYRSIPKDRIFVTLTFIDDVTDQQGSKIFNKFRTVLKNENKGFEFLRIAERQDGTGRIHFHVLMNKRLTIRRYNALWVLQQYNAGLRARREDGSEIPIEEIRDRYHHDVTTPFRKKDPQSMAAILNPLDIEKAYGIHGLSHYLTKYVTKQENAEFACLTWHCSRGVSKLFTKEVVAPSTFAYLLTFANPRVDRETGECVRPSVLSKTFFTMVYVHNKGAPLSRLKQLEQANKWIIQGFHTDQVPKINDDLYRQLLLTKDRVRRSPKTQVQ